MPKDKVQVYDSKERPASVVAFRRGLRLHKVVTSRDPELIDRGLVLLHECELSPPEATSFARRRQPNHMLVAQLPTHEVVGVVCLINDSGEGGVEVFIGTHPDYRRRGVASGLLLLSEKWCRAYGLHEALWAETVTDDGKAFFGARWPWMTRRLFAAPPAENAQFGNDEEPDFLDCALDYWQDGTDLGFADVDADEVESA